MTDINNVILNIDGKQVAAGEGETVLQAALKAGIYIPHLCYIPENETPLTACRLCLVEIEGKQEPVTACSESVSQGMVVSTSSSRIDRLRRTAVDLLIASHETDCGRCYKNGRCELQKLAAYLKLKLKSKRFQKTRVSYPVDDSNPHFTRNPNKCLLCGKCVWVCREKHGAGVLEFTRRGFETVIRPFTERIADDARCDSCGECVAVCPVGAIVPKSRGK